MKKEYPELKPLIPQGHLQSNSQGPSSLLAYQQVASGAVGTIRTPQASTTINVNSGPSTITGIPATVCFLAHQYYDKLAHWQQSNYIENLGPSCSKTNLAWVERHALDCKEISVYGPSTLHIWPLADVAVLKPQNGELEVLSCPNENIFIRGVQMSVMTPSEMFLAHSHGFTLRMKFLGSPSKSLKLLAVMSVKTKC